VAVAAAAEAEAAAAAVWPSDTRARVSDCTRRAAYVIMILLLKLFRTPTDYRRTWPTALRWHGVGRRENGKHSSTTGLENGRCDDH